MSQAIGTIFSLILGFIIWSIVILLSKGAYPFGSSGFLEGIVFFHQSSLPWLQLR